MSARLTTVESSTGMNEYLAAIRAMIEKPSARELGDAAADELRNRIARGAVRSKAEAKRVARRLTKRFTARYYKRGTDEHSYVREVCDEIAASFTGSRHFERKAKRS